MPGTYAQARWLAFSVHTGAWNRAALADRFAAALPESEPAPARLAELVCAQFGEDAPPDVKALARFLRAEPLLAPVFKNDAIKGPLLTPYTMQPTPEGIAASPLPALPTLRDLGRWLCLFDTEITWFADSHARQNRVTEEKLHHYRYVWIARRSGGVRLIETPKSRLKAIQRAILRDILDHVPPHGCAHGFTRGRSIKSFAAPHAGQDVVLRLDLKDFFHSVPVHRVGGLFRRLGYPPNVARTLRGFCTNAVSPHLAGPEFERLPWEERKRLRNKHLPQGAPTSAALANLCAWRLDCRLKGLADRYGYAYTRYADDMAFSGPVHLARRAGFIETLAGAIALEEGFCLNHRKTRLRTAAQRQRIAGVVVNDKPNCSRADRDRLKAILHNCVKHGPESQNRDAHPDFKAHLEGRVAHVAWLNPAHGAKLRDVLERIEW